MTYCLNNLSTDDQSIEWTSQLIEFARYNEKEKISSCNVIFQGASRYLNVLQDISNYFVEYCTVLQDISRTSGYFTYFRIFHIS